MLAPAAIEAVKQWKYRPYILNGEPVEVDTQVTVNFALGGRAPGSVCGVVFLVGAVRSFCMGRFGN